MSAYTANDPGCVKAHTSENVEHTILQHSVQPYVRSIISSHYAQFHQNAFYAQGGHWSCYTAKTLTGPHAHLLNREMSCRKKSVSDVIRMEKLLKDRCSLWCDMLHPSRGSLTVYPLPGGFDRGQRRAGPIKCGLPFDLHANRFALRFGRVF
jgi:hypothetical protein